MKAIKFMINLIFGLTLVMTMFSYCISHACEIPTVVHFSHLLAINKTDEDADKLFEGYPKNDAFDSFVRSHLASECHLKKEHLLYATWFLNGRPNVGMESIVDIKGHSFSCRNVYDWAIQNSGNSELNAGQLATLNKALLDLPESTLHPAIEHLLIFSFCVNNKWITRTYDMNALPQAVLQIYQITRAPLDKEKPTDETKVLF